MCAVHAAVGALLLLLICSDVGMNWLIGSMCPLSILRRCYAQHVVQHGGHERNPQAEGDNAAAGRPGRPGSAWERDFCDQPPGLFWILNDLVESIYDPHFVNRTSFLVLPHLEPQFCGELPKLQGELPHGPATAEQRVMARSNHSLGKNATCGESNIIFGLSSACPCLLATVFVIIQTRWILTVRRPAHHAPPECALAQT
jgi:hypothetical protein